MIVTRDWVTGAVKYSVGSNTKYIDKDGDGNIDEYTWLIKNEDGSFTSKIYVNPNDDGKNSFQEVVKQKYPGGNWNPLNWF